MKSIYLKIVLVICILNFVLRLPFLGMHLNYDEFVYLDGVKQIIENNLNPFVEFWGYKPPLMFIIPAILSCFIGPNQVIPKLTIYLYSSLIIFFAYLIGRDIFKNEKVGFWSSLFIFFYPTFMAQSFVFQDPIPTSLFFTMSFYFLYAKRNKLYILSSILLVMTRELGIIPIGIFLITDIIFFKKSIKDAIKIHFPALIVFSIWMLMNKYYLGWYLWPFNVGLANFRKFFMINFINENIDILFFQYIPLFLLFLFCQKYSIYKKLFYVVFIIFTINLLISNSVAAGFRYIFFPIPVLIVMFIDSVFRIIKNNSFQKTFLKIVLGVMIINHVFILMTARHYLSGDADLRLFKHINLYSYAISEAKKVCNDCVYVTNISAMYLSIENYSNSEEKYNQCPLDEEVEQCLKKYDKNRSKNYVFLLLDNPSVEGYKNKFGLTFYKKINFRNIFGEDEEAFYIYVKYL